MKKFKVAALLSLTSDLNLDTDRLFLISMKEYATIIDIPCHICSDISFTNLSHNTHNQFLTMITQQPKYNPPLSPNKSEPDTETD